MFYFDEGYYISSKLKQLQANNELDNGKPYTETSLRQAIHNAGMTVEEHYNAFGSAEGTNPNAYFNEFEYLSAKLAQLSSLGETDGGKPYTMSSLKKAMADLGLNPAEHYALFGSKETTSDGHLINPSNAFDANAYMAAKLLELQTGPEASVWANKTPADVAKAIADTGMNPLSHYDAFGATEAGKAGIPLVQTVPSDQRVTNDPNRGTLSDNVPTNYNAPTPAPKDAVARPVTKPADVDNRVPASVSPKPIIPDSPAKVPGDAGYQSPPPGLTDTNTKPVIPPSTDGTGNATDNWIVVKPDGSADLIKPGGGSAGTLPPGSVTPGEPVAPDLKPDPAPDPTPPTPGPVYTDHFLGRVTADVFQAAGWKLNDPDAATSDHDTVILDLGHKADGTGATTDMAQLMAAFANIKNVEQINLENMATTTVDVALLKSVNSTFKQLGFSDNYEDKDDHAAKGATVFNKVSSDITLVHTKYDDMKADFSDSDGILHKDITTGGTPGNFKPATAPAKDAANRFGYASVSIGTEGGTGTVNLITEKSISDATISATGITGGTPGAANETVVTKNVAGGTADATKSSFSVLNVSGAGNLSMDNSSGTQATTINAAGLTGKLTYAGNATTKSDITGGSGNDTVVLGNKLDVVKLGAGDDRLVVELGGTGLTLDLTGSNYDGGVGTDVLEIELQSGGSGPYLGQKAHVDAGGNGAGGKILWFQPAAVALLNGPTAAKGFEVLELGSNVASIEVNDINHANSVIVVDANAINNYSQFNFTENGRIYGLDATDIVRDVSENLDITLTLDGKADAQGHSAVHLDTVAKKYGHSTHIAEVGGSVDKTQDDLSSFTTLTLTGNGNVIFDNSKSDVALTINSSMTYTARESLLFPDGTTDGPHHTGTLLFAGGSKQDTINLGTGGSHDVVWFDYQHYYDGQVNNSSNKAKFDVYDTVTGFNKADDKIGVNNFLGSGTTDDGGVWTPNTLGDGTSFTLAEANLHKNLTKTDSTTKATDAADNHVYLINVAGALEADLKDQGKVFKLLFGASGDGKGAYLGNPDGVPGANGIESVVVISNGTDSYVYYIDSDADGAVKFAAHEVALVGIVKGVADATTLDVDNFC